MRSPVPQAGQVKVSGSPVALAVGGTALIAFSGFLLPAAALACLELRSRLAFIGERHLNPHLGAT
jgi:hypothetical protein